MPEIIPFNIPDIGDFKSVDVIEVMVKAGDKVQRDQTLVTLESDKATVDVPAEHDGIIHQMLLEVGSKVETGTPCALIEVEAEGTNSASSNNDKASATHSNASDQVLDEAAPTPEADQPQGAVAATAAPSPPPIEPQAPLPSSNTSLGYASPHVRKLANNMKLDLSLIQGSGKKGRILAEDVFSYVANRSEHSTATLAAATVDYPNLEELSAYGTVESLELSKLKTITGARLSQSWPTTPQVSQHLRADITELDAYRQLLKQKNPNLRISVLPFIIAGVIHCLKQFPRFNASLASANALYLKKYYNIGVAVATDSGLMVPVIHQADLLGIMALTEQLEAVSNSARSGRISPKLLSGASFTVSSLGGTGGDYFTPIVNPPEVAILGVGKATMQPHWNGEQFEPRLLLPLSVSYDHRVIDGAEGASFIEALSQTLSDIRNLLL